MRDVNTLNGTGPDGVRARLAALPDPCHRRGIRHRHDQLLLLALAYDLAHESDYGPRGRDPYMRSWTTAALRSLR